MFWEAPRHGRERRRADCRARRRVAVLVGVFVAGEREQFLHSLSDRSAIPLH
jgi:hypothetical protein